MCATQAFQLMHIYNRLTKQSVFQIKYISDVMGKRSDSTSFSILAGDMNMSFQENASLGNFVDIWPSLYPDQDGCTMPESDWLNTTLDCNWLG